MSRSKSSSKAQGKDKNDISSVESNTTSTFAYNHDLQCWVASSPSSSLSRAANTSPSTLKVATWNMLFDFYHPEKLHSPQRIQSLLDILRSTDADIIALQEVTPPFLQMILATDWIRAKYFASDCPDAHTVQHYGQLLLATKPFTTIIYPLSGSKYRKHTTSKQAVVGIFQLHGRPLVVPVVHLTSDRASGDVASKRDKQMQTLFKTCSMVPGSKPSDHPDCIVLGDFNMKDPEAYALPRPFTDVWTTLRPAEAGITYDPRENTMAAITTLSNMPGRLDRVITRVQTWAPRSIELIGNNKVTITTSKGDHVEIFPSDHYGLVATFSQATREGEPAAVVQPHISYPAPRKSTSSPSTVAATPAAPLAEYTTAAYAPVLSAQKHLALFESEDPISRFLSSVLPIPDTDALAKRNAALALLHGLLGTAMQACAPSSVWRMDVVGSAGLGVSMQGDDVDVLVMAQATPWVTFVPALIKVLQEASEVTRLRLVPATVPIVQARVCGIPFDLQYACMPADSAMTLPQPLAYYFSQPSFDASALRDEDVVKMDPASRAAFASIADMQVIIRSVGASRDDFLTLLTLVRGWASLRGVYSHALGYIGGYGWSILAAYVQSNFFSDSPSPSQMLYEFFSTFATWRWEQAAVALEFEGQQTFRKNDKKDFMCILTASKPFKNSARNVTRSTRKVIIEELGRAYDILTRADSANPLAAYQTLFAKSDVLHEAGTYIQIQVSALTSREYLNFVGFVESRVVSVVQQLDQVVDETARVRPLDHAVPLAPVNFPFSCAYYVGVALNASTHDAAKNLILASVDFAPLSRFRGKTDGMHLAVSVVRPEEMLAPAEDELALDSTLDAQPSDLPLEYTAGDTWSDTASEAGSVYSEAEPPSLPDPSVKARMHTSEEVYNRIMWDGHLNKEEFIVGYEDRFVGVLEVPFEEFDTANIPFHRIRTFKRNQEVVWDRKARIDVL
eukprot:TRINITY_DN9857_c0_g1_i1.p1 TRINITY_DN9857_c0_g1~~TRINITY_DN9857_c0_g1_i1.p1  ORF type:complete len:962 (+),score=263.64 TRINITY_DN9857_c0_g1_i1:104-2989(+)